jgi:hypothetical protein
VNGKVKEVFPGGNTCLGFYSYYDQIIAEDARRIMVIKGGPGVGKSSFMRKIAEAMVEKGFDAELHHCSSDNNSLDGVMFPQIGVALIDGTSPHIVDPRNPGAVDEIIHLGDYWNEAEMRRHKTEIITTNRKVGGLFARAYRFIKAAKVIHEDLESIVGAGLDYGKANCAAETLIRDVIGDIPVAAKPGSLRKLFASAITPDGFKHHLETLLEPMERVYQITGEAGTGKATLLEKLARRAVESGLNCEAYYCAFDPHKMEHLTIPALKIGLTTAVEPHRAEVQPDCCLSVMMDTCLDRKALGDFAEAISADKNLIRQLFEKACACLDAAKTAHDAMEQYYIPNMDFAAISGLGERTLERILGYAAEPAANRIDVLS